MRQELDLQKFSQSVKKWRTKELKMTLRESAVNTGLSYATINRCENGSEPTVGTYITLCNWMGVSLTKYLKTIK